MYSAFRLSIECFKCYIKCSQSFELFEYLNTEKVWDLLGTESTHVEGCTVLAKYILLSFNFRLKLGL